MSRLPANCCRSVPAASKKIIHGRCAGRRPSLKRPNPGKREPKRLIDLYQVVSQMEAIGMLEYWNNGMLGLKAEEIIFIKSIEGL